MIQIAVCDDNPLHLDHTMDLAKSALLDTPVRIDSFTSAEDLYSALETGSLLPDIAILDIQMRDEDGIHLADQLNTILPECQIIFITGYPEYASSVYETRHVWFVLKEQADRFLPAALRRALLNLSQESPHHTVSIRSDGKKLLVVLNDVLYVERIGRKYQVNLKDSSFFLTSRNPVALTSQLLRCHQGFWVNPDHITGLDHNEFLLRNGFKIPIGRTFRDAARSAFFDRFTAQ